MKWREKKINESINITVKDSNLTLASDYVTTAVKLEFRVRVHVQFRRRVRCSSCHCRWYRKSHKILNKILEFFIFQIKPGR